MASKVTRRGEILDRRRLLSVAQIEHAAQALAAVANAAATVREATTVAAYVSHGAEPGTGPLLETLRAAGTRLLVPVLEDDNDLDWAVYTGPEQLAPARFGLWEATGPRLGREAIVTADLVLTPGLAASPTGERLGRGGGSYDRALARLDRATPVWTVLYPWEYGVAVPTEPHDRSVDGVLTPEGIHLFA